MDTESTIVVQLKMQRSRGKSRQRKLRESGVFRSDGRTKDEKGIQTMMSLGGSVYK